jgi:hypothetical protein
MGQAGRVGVSEEIGDERIETGIDCCARQRPA